MVFRAQRRYAGLRRGTGRGFTLIELLVVIAIASFMMAAVVMGLGAATNAKLKGATTLLASAIRGAYTRSNSTAHPTRVVMDLKEHRVWIEEGASKMLVTDYEEATKKDDDPTNGGADAATAAERKAEKESEKITKGPRAPKARFTAVKQVGFDDSGKGRALGDNIRFREVFVAHQGEPVSEGRAYLYVWPGGQTELAYIQLAKGSNPTDRDTMTLFVHPLTGKVRIQRGAKTIEVPESPEDASEREEMAAP